MNAELKELCQKIDEMRGQVEQLENLAAASRAVFDALEAAKQAYLDSLDPPKAA